MKRMIRHIILTVILGASCISCDKWLEVEPKSNLSTENFYSTDTEAEQALMGVYNALMPLSTYSWMMSELRSDNIWADNAEDSATQRDYIDIFSYNPNISIISTVNDAWVDLYEVVARANLLLQELGEVELPDGEVTDPDTPATAAEEEPNIRLQIAAEARLLRGYAYFELVRYFGRVPMVLTPQSVDEAMETPQSEDYEIYEQVIIPDLEFAARHLTDEILDVKGEKAADGRANQVAAKALLGRVYLTMAGFPLYDSSKEALAVEALEWVIDYSAANKEKYWAKSATDWQKMWISDNDNKYHIFEIQYVARDGYGNPMVYWTAPKVGSDYIDLQMSGYQLAGTTELLALFKTDRNGDGAWDDVRYDGTFDFEFSSSLTFFDKFFEHKKKRAALGYGDISSQIVTRNYFPINHPIIRLEDVMLMYAELVGPTPKGVEQVNKIRTRAGLAELTMDQTADFDKVVEEERRRELAGEGIRWHDLVRHNKHIEALKHKFISYSTDSQGNVTRPKSYAMAARVMEGTHLYPIPDVQMKAKTGLYEQNEAYK